MRSKWPDFLFTLGIRSVCGAILAVIAGLLICAPISRHATRRPLLVWVFGDEAHPLRPYYWFAGWSLAGALVAMLTTPRWQTPWYRRERLDLNLFTDGETPDERFGNSGPGLADNTVTIRTTSADGEEHEYSSMDAVPPEIRAEIEALHKEASQQPGEVLSVTERAVSGDAILLKTTQRTNVSVYRITDESGVERVYRSLEEMPPELRAAVVEAEQKAKEEHDRT